MIVDTAITYLDNLFSFLLFFFNLVLMDGMFDNTSVPALCALLILKGPTLQFFKFYFGVCIFCFVLCV